MPELLPPLPSPQRKKVHCKSEDMSTVTGATGSQCGVTVSVMVPGAFTVAFPGLPVPEKVTEYVHEGVPSELFEEL